MVVVMMPALMLMLMSVVLVVCAGSGGGCGNGSGRGGGEDGVTSDAALGVCPSLSRCGDKKNRLLGVRRRALEARKPHEKKYVSPLP